jgi:hypothetical protein
VQLLALGPQSLASLQTQLSTAANKKQLSRAALSGAAEGGMGRLERLVGAVADPAPRGTYRLKPECLGRALPGWAHYTPAQRSTLRLIQRTAGVGEEEESGEESEQEKGDESEARAGASTNPQPSPSAAARALPAPVTVTTIAECLEAKKKFRTRCEGVPAF